MREPASVADVMKINMRKPACSLICFCEATDEHGLTPMVPLLQMLLYMDAWNECSQNADSNRYHRCLGMGE